MKTAENETTEAVRRPERQDAFHDNFRHIICFLCYPAFEQELLAPHDAECICGKPVSAGDGPAPRTSPQCALCDAMAEEHYRSRHGAYGIR